MDMFEVQPLSQRDNRWNTVILGTGLYTGKPQQIPKNRPSRPLVIFADASDGLILLKEARQAKDTVIDTMQQGIKMVCLDAPGSPLPGSARRVPGCTSSEYRTIRSAL
jgi:hypothetical protein